MNLLDLVVVVGIVGAAVGGYRLGFLARVLSWTGLGAGLLVAVHFIPDVMTALGDANPRARLLGALAFLCGLGLLGQAFGLALGALIHTSVPLAPRGRQGDRIAGAVVGGLGVLVALWLLLPALTSAPGWPARAVRGSTIAQVIDDVAPEPPDAAREIGRMIDEAPFPTVLDPFTEQPDSGAPPGSGLGAEADARVAASAVKVEGRACDQIQDGSGFVAGPDLVVTNAHVVAGEERTEVQLPDGSRAGARVVVFDPDRDIAVLRVTDLGLEPLPLGTAEVGTDGAVYGFPGGGALRAAPARIADEITARGTDIYRTSQTRRSVYVLAAELAPGDSGGALVDREGRVVGVAFAIDPGRDATAYALTNDEVAPVLDEAGTRAVATGPCLVG